MPWRRGASSTRMAGDRPGQMKDDEYADLMTFLLYTSGSDAGKTHLAVSTASASMTALHAGARP